MRIYFVVAFALLSSSSSGFAQIAPTVVDDPQREGYTCIEFRRCCEGTGPCPSSLPWEPFHGESTTSQEEARQDALDQAESFVCSMEGNNYTVEEQSTCPPPATPEARTYAQRACDPCAKWKVSVLFYCCNNPDFKMVHHGTGRTRRQAECAARQQVARTAGLICQGRYCIYCVKSQRLPRCCCACCR